MRIPKISFDFDATLSRYDAQVYASSLVDLGYEVWIVTSRWDLDNLDLRWKSKKTGEPWRHQDLFQVAEDCGISRDRIHFTNRVKKAKFLEANNFLLHLDDDDLELIEIMKNGIVVPINIDYTDWKYECDKVINKK
jgi:hypothetical protein